MKKHTAIKLLGGSVGAAAKSVMVTSQAVTQWPEDLPQNIQDRVIAGVVRRDPILSAVVKQKISQAEE